MLVRISHPDISNNEKTYLTTAYTAGGTTLTVQNIEGFAVSNYLVLGKLGEEKTEIVLVHASTAPSGSTITLNAAASFNHPINCPVTYIGFNQVAIYSATSKTGTYTQCSGSPVSLEVDDEATEFNDAVGSSSTWYKVRYYNSTSAVYSSYSDLVEGSGYTEDSLRKILDRASSMANDRDNKIFSLDEKIDIVNIGYQKVINKLEKADHKRFLKKGYADMKNSYDTGTVSVADSATAVTGSGTTWSTGWTGKKITFGDEGFPYEISSVDSTTGLTLTRAYVGTGDALSGSSYKIFQDEYDIYDESTGVEVVDLKKIEMVVNHEGNIVNEYDMHRTETGYYLKREDDNLKFCVNYIPSTSDEQGRWTIWYRYQPTKLDTMADEPEFPKGYSGILDYYLAAEIRKRARDTVGYSSFINDYNEGVNKMLGESVPRTNEKRGFRIDRNLRASNQHDSDWGYDALWGRRTIGT